MAGVQRDFAPLLRKLNDERRTFLRRQPPSSGTDRRERIGLRDGPERGEGQELRHLELQRHVIGEFCTCS